MTDRPDELGDHERLSGQFLILFGLTGFAISQPILSIAGTNPTLFVFNDVSRSQMIVGALLFALGPPLLLWLIILAASRISLDIGRTVFLGVTGLLVALAGVQFGREFGLGAVSWLLGIALGIGGVFAIARSRVVGEWLRYTAVLPVIAVGAFLFTSASSALLRAPSSVERNEIAGVEPSIVVVLFDELPTATLLADDGTIDGQTFPNFERFAAGSTWYRNFTTLSASTTTAVPSMLSGSLPRTDEPLWTNYPDNVFSLLAPTHGLTVQESFTQLCGTTACTTAGPGESVDSSSRPGAAADQLLDLWADRLRGTALDRSELDDFEEIAGEPLSDPDELEALGLFPDDETVRRHPARLTEFVDAISATDNPHFYFLHLILPHIPFRWYPDGTQYRAEPNPFVTTVLSRTEPWIAAVEEQRHLLQTQYADQLLGTILDTLESEGILDETVVVVAADHGMSFALGEDRRSMDVEGRAGTAYVPLMVKLPSQVDGTIDNQNLSSVDFLPLVADAVGIDVPWDVVGATPGSEEVVARGDRKFLFPIEGAFASQTIGDRVDYDGSGDQPASAVYQLPHREAGDPQIAPLLSILDSASLMGTRLGADLAVGGSISLLAYDDLIAGGRDPVTAFIQGELLDGPAAGEIVFAVDGEIVTGSVLYDVDGTTEFLAFLPSDVAGRGFELRAAVINPDGTVVEMTIKPG